ncbi:hypothetical protein RclHR1_12960001 [Rhizophagus clarus]|uniref:Protein kinase domain-containing protein n=1 Tax=Rhizophagus clarus TaxID=94130 RepID=A0A2Z6Q8I7_9GLOM|nr:hypothetical protein RclHR1_12960001 [Rhizophagus clarus]
MEEKPKNLWNKFNANYQIHVTISTVGSITESKEVDERIIYMEDLEKRKKAYGICGECNEPGTGLRWCRPCCAKRFKDNFNNWTSGNKDIDEFIQQSQLNAVHSYKCLEWMPYEKFQNVTYIAEGGFGKIYSADWPEGHIRSWNIKNQKWNRCKTCRCALKSLNDNSSDIVSSDFLNEIKNHLQICLANIVQCFGITRNPNTNEYMMVLEYCEAGNLRNYLIKSKEYIDYTLRISKLRKIAGGLLDIHSAGKVHKDFHSGNILCFDKYGLRISDLGMCQQENKETQKEEGIYGVLPYMAPEVLCGHQYTKSAEIYSFGIIMNEFLSEEIPYSDIPHNEFLAIQICKGHRPKISEDVPKLLADLIMKCWDAEIKNRPTTKELYLILKKWYYEIKNIEGNGNNSDGDSDDSDSEIIKSDKNSEIYSQIKKCDETRKKKFKNRSYEDKSINIQTHPQAIYTSRLLNFKSLPKPENSSDLSSFQFNSVSAQLSELGN